MELRNPNPVWRNITSPRLPFIMKSLSKQWGQSWELRLNSMWCSMNFLPSVNEWGWGSQRKRLIWWNSNLGTKDGGDGINWAGHNTGGMGLGNERSNKFGWGFITLWSIRRFIPGGGVSYYRKSVSENNIFYMSGPDSLHLPSLAAWMCVMWTLCHLLQPVCSSCVEKV